MILLKKVIIFIPRRFYTKLRILSHANLRSATFENEVKKIYKQNLSLINNFNE